VSCFCLLDEVLEVFSDGDFIIRQAFGQNISVDSTYHFIGDAAEFFLLEFDWNHFEFGISDCVRYKLPTLLPFVCEVAFVFEKILFSRH